MTSYISSINSKIQPSHYKSDKLFSIDLDLSEVDVNISLSERSGAPKIRPELASPDRIRDVSVYKRFADTDKKALYRCHMLENLKTEWTKIYGPQEAEKMSEKFLDLANHLDENGAAIFGALLEKEKFEVLISRYNQILSGSGSRSWIHSYVNLANHPNFLADKEFNLAFLNPTLVALISYRIGGPIRIVDARGKDAEPISVLAQDNMLHIDNTPFNDEYKTILTWEKNKASGPKGQNFVFLPGTHKGARNCFVDEKGTWSTENASIFIDSESINQVFEFQKEVRGCAQPMVVEATHPEKPLTTVFAAGSLVHHRFRTEQGFARSCMILAFHRAQDNPGQFIPPEHLEDLGDATELNKLLFSYQNGDNEQTFLQALTKECKTIGSVLKRLESKEDPAELICPEAREISSDRVCEWKRLSTAAPTVEEIKKSNPSIPLNKTVSHEEFVRIIGKMMKFDKHGPLDLILYSDSHEEIRKWGRNQIREIKLEELEKRLADWAKDLQQPEPNQLLSPKQLEDSAKELAQLADQQKDSKSTIFLRKGEKISREDAYRSIKQLTLDLGESITRCEDRQAFLSTSLFLFWAADTLMRFQEPHNPEVQAIGKKLLANYVSTGILIEKQIQGK